MCRPYDIYIVELDAVNTATRVQENYVHCLTKSTNTIKLNSRLDSEQFET